MKKTLAYIWYRIIGCLFRIMPVRNNCVVIESFFGKNFGDSPMCIANELIRRGGYHVVLLTKKSNANIAPFGAKIVKRGTLSELYYLSTAKVWVDNVRKPYGVKKRRGQYYIQTWHSSLRMKKIERDAEKQLSHDYILAAKNDSKMINAIISGCKFSSTIYKKAFWYNGDVFEYGTPRCDLFFNSLEMEKIREKIKKIYGIPSNKKVVLYAPTFRSSNNESQEYIDLDQLSDRLGTDYFIISRMHPNSGYKIRESILIRDASNYPDMQDLLCAADYLVTDYSSCCFDMLVAKKPCILFVADYKNFKSNERDFYFKFSELPFPKVESVDDLVNAITRFDTNNYARHLEAFSHSVGLVEDGNATKRTCDLIEERMLSGISKTKITKLFNFYYKLHYYFLKKLLTFNITNKNIKDLVYREYCYKKIKRRYNNVIKEFIPSDNSSFRSSNKIWFCWFQGMDAAPFVVKKCYESLVANIPKHMEVVVITMNNYRDYVDFPLYVVEKYKKGLIGPAHFSDLLRLELLRKYGGLWIDSTVFVSGKIKEGFFKQPFFVYKNFSLYRKEELATRSSNWLIYSNKPNNNLIVLTQKLLYSYWQKYNHAMCYHIFHLFFSLATKKLADEYNSIIPMSNIPPHILQFELQNDYSEDRWRSIKSASVFHKLNHRLTSDKPNSFYKRILGDYSDEK